MITGFKESSLLVAHLKKIVAHFFLNILIIKTLHFYVFVYFLL